MVINMLPSTYRLGWRDPAVASGGDGEVISAILKSPAPACSVERMGEVWPERSFWAPASSYGGGRGGGDDRVCLRYPLAAGDPLGGSDGEVAHRPRVGDGEVGVCAGPTANRGRR
jgi:hypothetical protein